MAKISEKTQELIQQFLEEKEDAKLFDILDSPARWNYEYFLSLLPLLTHETQRIVVLAPEFVAKGRSQIIEDRPPRHALLARNILDTVITLPKNLFNHRFAPVTLLLFNVNKVDSTILFINATQGFQADQGQTMVQDAQASKILGTYLRVRAPKHAPSELSSPVCYAAQLDEIKPGVIVDQYAYLATLEEVARNHCSVSPADYVC